MVSVVRVELPGPIVREPEVAKIPNIALKHTLVGSICTASLEMNGLVEVRFGQNLERLLWNVTYVKPDKSIVVRGTMFDNAMLTRLLRLFDQFS